MFVSCGIRHRESVEGKKCRTGFPEVQGIPITDNSEDLNAFGPL
jgi:hypothetical protein